MAKRDKLYTVNKWNKPFLEEERRKKLFLWGGDSLGIKPGINEGLAGMRWGYGNTWGSDYVAPVSSLTKLNSIDRAVTDFNQYSNPNYYQNLAKTQYVEGNDKPLYGSNVVNDTSSTGTAIADTKPLYNTNWLDSVSKITNAAGNIANGIKATKTIAQQQAELNPIKTGGISSLGKAGINLAAGVAGELGKRYISNGFHTAAGDVIDTVGSTASTILPLIPGVGWAAAPIVLGASKLLSGVANAAFGSETYDNGATAYTNRLNSLNPNGSNEYLANLLASTGIGPRATYRDGWLRDKGENEAAAINNAQDLALTRFQRGVRDAFGNNNWNQLQYALNDYNVTAMGGKLNKCKCNKKSYGGYLNSATPTGFNFLSDLTNIQMQKNQNQGGTAASVGNSFMNTPDMGITFAKGGSIHINPAHKGDFTAKAKRHGMGVQQFASYVLSHKDKFPSSTVKQAVFAKNANTWKKAFGGKLNYGKDKDNRNSGFFNDPTLYELGGTLQAAGSNWGRATVVEEGDTHENNPYQGVQVGVDPEGTPNLVEEGEVIWNDYVFSNRITVPKEVCKRLRIGQKKNGYTFADAAKKLLVESKERPNDPISKNGLEANMQLLEDAQEEVKRKMEAELAIEQFNSLPPEQQVAIMNQEGQRAQDAVAQEQMAQEIQNMPPEQQQAIAQQMMAEQAAAQGLGMPQGQPSPEEQAMMQQQMAQQQSINPQEAIAQASAMQQQALAGMALGGKLCFGGKVFAEGGPKNKQYINGAKSHWETNEQGHRVLVPNTPFENTGFGGGRFGVAGGGGEWGEDPAPFAPKKRDWLAIDYKESFNDAYRKARNQKKKTFWFNGKEYSTDYNPNLTEEQVRQGMTRYQDKGLIIAPWEHSFGGRLFAEGGELNGEQPTEQTDNEMAKYSDEELQDMIDDYQEAETGEVKVTKGKLARLKKKAEKAQAELERRHAEENEEQPQEARQEPSQEELQAAAQAQAMLTLQPIEGQPQEGMPLEGMSPEQAMMMQQQMGGQPLMSPEEMAAAELQQQQGNGQYAYGGKLYPTGGKLSDYAQYFPSMYYDELAGLLYDKLGLNLRVETSYANEKDKLKNAINAISKEDFIKAMRANNYDVDAALRSFDFTSSDYVHPQQAALDLVEPSGYTQNLIYNLNGNDNTYKYSDINPDIYRNAMLLVYYDRNPEARNSGWTFSNNPYRTYANVDFHDATSAVGNNGNKMVAESFYANDPAWSQLTEEERKLKGNELAAALEGTQAYRNFSKYLRDNRNSQYVKDYFTELANRGSKIAKNALADWDNMTASKFDTVIKNLREDASAPPNSPGNKNNNALGLGHFTPAFAEDWTNRYWIKDADGNYSQVTGGIADADKDKYIAINTNPYQVTVDNNNYNDYYYRLKTDADNAATTTDNESNYLTVGWKPKIDYTGLALGVAPGLTGLAMQLGRGAPDMSELDKAVAAYERNTGTMVAPHLTHGLIRPAIIDPRVTENNLNARRLGTNRLLMNTGSTPSRGATILANDANTIGQLGQAMINNWRENRQQEQAAAAFNRETNTTNANILNQVDQFNAQTQSALARDAAQLRYNVAKDKIAARDAYYAGLMGNLGSVFKGGYEAWRENQRKNERDLLAASGVFGETNGLIDDWLGISKVDPKTHQVVRGYNTGMYYWINPNTGKAEYLKTPPLATNTINARGGKIKKNKKRKGYTF